MLAVLPRQEEGKQGQRSEKEAEHSRSGHGVGLGEKGLGHQKSRPLPKTCLLVTMMTSSAMLDISLMVK